MEYNNPFSEIIKTKADRSLAIMVLSRVQYILENADFDNHRYFICNILEDISDESAGPKVGKMAMDIRDVIQDSIRLAWKDYSYGFNPPVTAWLQKQGINLPLDEYITYRQAWVNEMIGQVNALPMKA